MKNLFKTYIGVACLMVGISSCSDDFLKEKKDYNNMTTVDVYSDKGQTTLYLPNSINSALRLIILLFAGRSYHAA